MQAADANITSYLPRDIEKHPPFSVQVGCHTCLTNGVCSSLCDGIIFLRQKRKNAIRRLLRTAFFHGIPKMKTGGLGFRGIIRHRPKPTVIPFRDGALTTKPRTHNALCVQTYPRPALFGRCSHGRPNSAHHARRWQGCSSPSPR